MEMDSWKLMMVVRHLIEAYITSMLLVVVGAGASYDAVEQTDDQSRMPLVAGLFDNRSSNKAALMTYPQATPIVAELRNALKNGVNTVEEVLAQINQQAESQLYRQKQLMALRLYLRRTIVQASNGVIDFDGGITSYTSLVSKLHKYQIQHHDPVVVVDFNYDPLLEYAITNEYGIKLNEMNQYTSSNEIKLIKPHGSVKWLRKPSISRPAAGDKIIIGSPDDLIERVNWIIVEDSEIYVKPDWRDVNVLDIPALAVPIKDKNSFECPDFLIDKMDALIPNTTKLITIGWRGAEEHFKSFLRKIPSPPKTLIVGSSDEGTQEVASNLSGCIQPPYFYDDGFMEFVSARTFDEFVASSH
jgi:hypothetical protein